MHYYFAPVSSYKCAGSEQIRAAFVRDGFGSLLLAASSVRAFHRHGPWAIKDLSSISYDPKIRKDSSAASCVSGTRNASGDVNAHLYALSRNASAKATSINKLLTRSDRARGNALREKSVRRCYSLMTGRYCYRFHVEPRTHM